MIGIEAVAAHPGRLRSFFFRWGSFDSFLGDLALVGRKSRRYSLVLSDFVTDDFADRVWPGLLAGHAFLLSDEVEGMNARKMS
jgi:hypothetical protein